jgi:hypothetical protein
MTSKNRTALADRVARAAEAALAAQVYVSAIDVLHGVGWLDISAEKRWRQSQVDGLEGVIQTNLSRISEAMKLFRDWATAKELRHYERQGLLVEPQAVAAARKGVEGQGGG